MIARGDCEQVNARTARCPVTEDTARVKLGNRDDRASVEGLVAVLGGTGDDGRFDIAQVTRIDKVVDCEVAASNPLQIRVKPEISGDTATFQVACQQLGGCDGTLEPIGARGQDFGSGSFTDLPDDPQTFSPVTVDLTAAAVEALAGGAIVQVAHGETGGYRAFMQSG